MITDKFKYGTLEESMSKHAAVLCCTHKYDPLNKTSKHATLTQNTGKYASLTEHTGKYATA